MAERAPLDARLELAGAWLDLAAALLLTAGCRRVSPVGDLCTGAHAAAKGGAR